MSEEKTLVPIKQKQVLFYGDEIIAVLINIDGQEKVYVPVRPVCENLGVDWSGQRQRINRDAVLSKYVQFVGVTPTKSERRGNPTRLCLPLDYIGGFLFGINANRVKPELKERLVLYQEQCYKVLAEAFQEGRLTNEPTFEDLLNQADPDAVQAYQMAQAIVKLARNQILLEARLTNRLDDHQRRLEEVEATLSNADRYITREQASRISQAVRAIGLVLTKRTGRNEYGAIYGELYRKFDIAAYRELPASKYDEAIDWLSTWYQDLTDTTLPF